jgi:hypothetical protein
MRSVVKPVKSLGLKGVSFWMQRREFWTDNGMGRKFVEDSNFLLHAIGINLVNKCSEQYSPNKNAQSNNYDSLVSLILYDNFWRKFLSENSYFHHLILVIT